MWNIYSALPQGRATDAPLTAHSVALRIKRRAQLAGFDAESSLKADIARVETTVKADIARVEAALRAEIASVRAEIARVADRTFNRLSVLVAIVVGILFAAFSAQAANHVVIRFQPAV